MEAGGGGELRASEARERESEARGGAPSTPRLELARAAFAPPRPPREASEATAPFAAGAGEKLMCSVHARMHAAGSARGAAGGQSQRRAGGRLPGVAGDVGARFAPPPVRPPFASPRLPPPRQRAARSPPSRHHTFRILSPTLAAPSALRRASLGAARRDPRLALPRTPICRHAARHAAARRSHARSSSLRGAPRAPASLRTPPPCAPLTRRHCCLRTGQCGLPQRRLA
jgi:hypothetical protein